MADRLAGGNAALALLCNTIATGAALVALILAFGPISGAHLNPAVTLADAISGGFAWRHVPGYLAAQFDGSARRPFGGLRGRQILTFPLPELARDGREDGSIDVSMTFTTIGGLSSELPLVLVSETFAQT
jgi:hypothetical protein